MGHGAPRERELLREAAAEFISRESNRQSLITVTRVDLSPDAKRAIIFLTVLPEESEATVIYFLSRRMRDFREFLKTKVRLRQLPQISFEIDLGEKNRQRIDELSRE